MVRLKIIVGSIILVWMIVCSPCQAGTLVSDLIADFRILTDEIAAQGSIVGDSDIVVFLNRAQDKIVRLGGYLPKKYDIVHASGSTSYQLPVNVKWVTTVDVKATAEAGNWVGVVFNDGFIVDTTLYQYYTRWDSVAYMRLYIKGDNFVANDTIRVSYQGEANDLTDTTDTCEVPTDLQTFIIEEAIANYYRSKQNFTAQQQTQNQTRLDMGLIKKVEQ